MILLHGHDAIVMDWAARRHGGLGRTPDIALGVLNADGVLVGALLLQTYNPWTWELEVYGQTSNDVAKQFFSLVFEHAGVCRLEVKTTRDNRAIRKAAPRWGFTWDGVRKHYYGPHGDALCWFMTPETCRWIDGKHTQNAEAA